jgi:hypothetical protein
MGAQRAVVNLDDRVQNMQIRYGVGVTALGLAAAMVMRGHGVGVAMHALLVPVLFIGAYGVCAGLARTCGLTAMAGRRFTETGSEPIADRVELARLRRRGAAVIATSFLLSLLATALLYFLSR